MNSSRPHLLRESLRLGWGGARANLHAGVVLWLVGSAIVASYYGFPPVRQFFDAVGTFKDSFTPWFAMVSTAFFGGLLPYLFQVAFLPAAKRQPLRHVPWLLVFWALHGWQIDALYRVQALLFGDSATVSVLLKKTLVDQFIWSPFIALPQVLLVYLFVEKECSLQRTRLALRRRSYLARAIPIMIVNWVIWIPAVALIYLLPLALQLPLQNLILTMWCLLLIFFAKNGDGSTVPVD